MSGLELVVEFIGSLGIIGKGDAESEGDTGILVGAERSGLFFHGERGVGDGSAESTLEVLFNGLDIGIGGELNVELSLLLFLLELFETNILSLNFMFLVDQGVYVFFFLNIDVNLVEVGGEVESSLNQSSNSFLELVFSQIVNILQEDVRRVYGLVFFQLQFDALDS